MYFILKLSFNNNEKDSTRFYLLNDLGFGSINTKTRTRIQEKSKQFRHVITFNKLFKIKTRLLLHRAHQLQLTSISWKNNLTSCGAYKLLIIFYNLKVLKLLCGPVGW